MAETERKLLIPGPGPRHEIHREKPRPPMINHRGKEFGEIIERTTTNLQEVLQTKNGAYVMGASGTGGMEAAVQNLISPGDRVLALSMGSFGDRFAEIANTFGADLLLHEQPYGSAIEPEMIAFYLDRATYDSVLITHNETSTGVTNDLESVVKAVKDRSDALTIVDASSSAGSINLETDKWGIDCVVTGTQKGLLAPPGVVVMTMSPDAWEKYDQNKNPRYYFDVGRARSFLEKGQTPSTPPVDVIMDLDETLTALLDEGLEKAFLRQIKMGDFVRGSVESMGFKLFADKRFASNTVTAVSSPHSEEILKKMYDRGFELGEGQGPVAGKIFRIGTLGTVPFAWLEESMRELESVVATLPK